MVPYIWVVVSAALSSFFALTGYSLRAFRRSQLEEAFEDHPDKDRLDTLDTHLIALRLNASLCRALANVSLVAGMIMLLGPEQVGWAIGICVVVVAVFGVAIPHAWASYASEEILAKLLPLMMVLRYLFWPVLAVMMWLDLPVRRLVGYTETEEEHAENAKQEILNAASEGQAEGAVDADEVDMIESVMEFGDTQAAEIMTPRTDIFALPADTPFDEAITKICEAGHTRVPLYHPDIDNIVGVLYAKDLLSMFGRDEPIDLQSVMRKPFYVPETKLLDDLLKEFKIRKIHQAIVLDEYGGTAGIVTFEDIMEEIVGDIADEYDQAEPEQIQRIDETTIQVDGRVYVDDLNDELKLEIPEDADYDTVAGLVFSELGYIPNVGDSLQAFGAEFSVLAADERKITRLQVRVLAKCEVENGND